MVSHIDLGIEKACSVRPRELPRHSIRERHFVLKNGSDLLSLCQWANEQDYYLCTLVATDERLEEDNTFKLYYVLSRSQDDELPAHEAGEVVVLEYSLSDPQYPRDYPSVRKVFPSVIPLEKEIFDLFGLAPQVEAFDRNEGFVLHACYPADLRPLRRTQSLLRIKEKFKNPRMREITPPIDLPEGMFIMPVGPIYAGVIEAGHFPFHVAGEVIEELPLRLGYKHRGIEKLFETTRTLEDGWELAERVSGDSSFAHSMAYCQAVEALGGVVVPEAAQYWRGLFLELERIYNHIADVGALAHDMAYDRVASRLAVLREASVQVNERLCGRRLLRQINCPGGVILSPGDHLDWARNTLSALVGQFLEIGKSILDMPACRDRMITTGILTYEEAREATGLVRRASGWRDHDFRRQFPQGIYLYPEVQAMLNSTITSENEEYPNRRVPIYPYHLAGDVFARMAIRIAEVETSTLIIEHLISRLKAIDPHAPTQVSVTDALRATPGLEFGMGYVEGWRGDIFYWIMKGPDNTIFRCKVRDPSLYNWHVFPLAVVRKPSSSRSTGYLENLLADFPLINKSFNLSYAGHDL